MDILSILLPLVFIIFFVFRIVNHGKAKAEEKMEEDKKFVEEWGISSEELQKIMAAAVDKNIPENLQPSIQLFLKTIEGKDLRADGDTWYSSFGFGRFVVELKHHQFLKEKEVFDANQTPLEEGQINIDKYIKGIAVFEEKYAIKIAEDHRKILITLAKIKNTGRLQIPFLSLELRGAAMDSEGYGPILWDYDVNWEYELTRFDRYDEPIDPFERFDFTNPFIIAETVKRSGHDDKEIFPFARGTYGDGFDVLYFKKRKTGQVERAVSVSREMNRMGFIAINLKALVRGAVLEKDVAEVEEAIGEKLDGIYFKGK